MIKMADNENASPSGEELLKGKDIEAPLGTMLIVLVYGAGTIVLWLYMYYILLKSSGYLGSF